MAACWLCLIQLRGSHFTTADLDDAVEGPDSKIGSLIRGSPLPRRRLGEAYGKQQFTNLSSHYTQPGKSGAKAALDCPAMPVRRTP